MKVACEWRESQKAGVCATERERHGLQRLMVTQESTASASGPEVQEVCV